MRLFNGVRFPLDYPCRVNVERLDECALPMITEYHQNGILLDTAVLKRLDKTIIGKILENEESVKALMGREVKITSTDVVARLLYDELGLENPAGKRFTASRLRQTTDDEALSSMVDQHPVVELILYRRELEKLKNTYIDTLPQWVQSDGRIHTLFKHTRTSTGRLASEHPNLQNIPIRSDLGQLIREAFIAAPGKKLVGGDYSQIEMRVAAYISRDPRLIEIFVKGLDIHERTALAVFGLPEEAAAWPEFKHKYRLPCKQVGFGILYGQTAKGLQVSIVGIGGPFWDEDQCATTINGWYELYSGVRDLLDVLYSRARRFRMVWDMFGRYRLIPETASVIPRIIASGLRQAGNQPFQAGAQGIIKLAMGEMMGIVTDFRSMGADVKPVLQIHDELIFEVDADCSEDFAGVMKEVMVGACPLDPVPVAVEYAIADDWKALK